MIEIPGGSAEFKRLLAALFDGGWTAEEAAQFERILNTSPESRAFYREYVELHAMLQFDQEPIAVTGDLPSDAREFLEYVRRACGQSCRPSQPMKSSGIAGAPLGSESDEWFDRYLAGESFAPHDHFSAGNPPGLPGSTGLPGATGAGVWLRPWMLFALMLVSAVAGGSLVWNLQQQEIAARLPERIHKLDENTRSPRATLVNVTNCRWSLAHGTADVFAEEIRPGQSLNLLEGVAEMNTELPEGGTGRFTLEGPLSMTIAGGSMPILQYGKLFIVLDSPDALCMGTPLGQVLTRSRSTLAIDAALNAVDVHVFAGEVDFKLIWPHRGGDAPEYVRVSSGASVRISIGRDGLLVTRGTANEDRFVASHSMGANRLNITDAYVQAIHKSKPIGYWRFETMDRGVVPNEMGDRWSCHVHGIVGFRDYRGNTAAEFGVRDSKGYLYSDDFVTDDLNESYSVEAWVKPSHVHQATLLGFVGWSHDAQAMLHPHGMLLELGGPDSPWGRRPNPVLDADQPHPKYHPKEIRFMHRASRGNEANCYSRTAYKLREWQHIVGVKDLDTVRLYVNGKLTRTVKSPTHIAGEMRLLMGQVLPSGIGTGIVERQFVGELDEVALYDRALSEKEIAEHYRLASQEVKEEAVY